MRNDAGARIGHCHLWPHSVQSTALSDDLAASASCRGIDNPGLRTSLREAKLRAADFVVMAVDGDGVRAIEGYLYGIVLDIVVDKLEREVHYPNF